MLGFPCDNVDFQQIFMLPEWGRELSCWSRLIELYRMFRDLSVPFSLSLSPCCISLHKRIPFTALNSSFTNKSVELKYKVLCDCYLCGHESIH